MVARSLVSAFATPIVNHRWPESEPLNNELASLILEGERTDSGLERSNIGGWHSRLDFLEWQQSAVVTLRARLRSFIVDLNRTVLDESASHRAGNFSLDGWANVLRHGGYNSLHSHPNAFWSGVYYVTGNETVDDRPFSGKLELVDPRPGASLAHAGDTRLYGRFLINPIAGQMLIFPSWLQHLVHPYFGNSARISIAFNVMLD